MSDQSQGPGWWMASDGKWYPPQPSVDQPTAPQPAVPPGSVPGAAPGAVPPGPGAGGPAGKSSTPLLIGLAVLVVVVLLGGLAFALTRPKTETVSPPTTPTSAPTTTAKPGSGDSSTTSKKATSTTQASDDTSTTAKGKTSTTKGKTSTPNFPAPKDPEGAIEKAGLPALSEEGTAVHFHTHLDVIVNGAPVTVPANIGIARSTISPLHTHDKSGIVHIEADAADELTTQQFFTEWEVELTTDCIGDFCTDGDHQLLGFVNGEQVDDPSQIVFAEHDEVVIWYGSSDDATDVPSSFDFPAGL